ncbi:MAG: protein kinase [Candidatus Azobacteroides sp.]|nr:protein kinase [Candidatus Azobacteroides sp.]
MEAVNRCDFNPGDFIDNNYRILTTLGEGSFGKVFKVKDTAGVLYAFKILKLWAVPPDIRKKLTDRFDMEFETGQINSNYLVHSIAHGYINTVPYIIMEYCSNGNLLQRINGGSPTNWIKITTEILYGLKDLHRYGKVHRDLKPENVLFKTDGTAVLTDFGIAGDRNKRLTEKRIWGNQAEIFGTYAYMPPEQVMANREATVLPTTDIFSFGVLLYFMLTGKLPFGRLENENDLGIYIKNGREENWDKATLSNNYNGKLFYNAISGCLKSDFKKRLQTADEVLKLIPTCSVKSSYKASENTADFQHEIKTGLLLRIMQGEEYKKTYKLNDLLTGKSRILTVGRNDGQTVNTISVTENQSCYISRMHCTLELDYLTKNWYIRDGQWDKDAEQGWRNSTNGTFVNSTEVSKDGMSLSPGDIISIGDLKFRVEGY